MADAHAQATRRRLLVGGARLSYSLRRYGNTETVDSDSIEPREDKARNS